MRQRVRAVPGLMAGAPPWALVVVGSALVLLGADLLVRPLSALESLGYYVGASCVLSGIGDLLSRRPDHRDTVQLAQAVGWTIAGVAVVAWLGRSIELLVPFVAVLLISSGVASLIALLRDRTAAHLLRALFGASEIAWGVMALWWPDVTLLVVAVLFGARTAAYGAALVWRGALPGRRVWSPTGRWLSGVQWGAAVLVLAVAAGGLYASHVFRGGVPVLDDFYEAPAVVPSEPGRLVRSEPYDGVLPAGMSAHRILYTTTATDGSPALASGVLAVPTEPATEAAPLVAWAHGTVGVARACAPSLGRYAITPEGMPAMDALAERGWAMVATDYTGMGTEGQFPYLIGAGEAHSVLDSARAAREVPGVRLGEQTVVWGHSQGGHAALWAGQLAASYAPDVDVVGTAAMSPAADPVGLAEAVAAHPEVLGASLGVAFVTDAYSRTYGLPLEEVVVPSARTIVREAASRCTSETGTLLTILAGAAIARDQPILREAPADGPLGRRLVENVPTGPFTAPLLVTHGTEDEVIPVRLTRNWVSQACAKGMSLRFRTYAGTHMSVLEPDGRLSAELEEWTADRFARVPAPTGCSLPDE